MRMQLTQVLALAALLAGPALAETKPPAFVPDAAKGQELAATCLACHTADGTRGLPANPILQAQHPEYIAKQLAEFKSGKRQNAIMAGMAAALSDEDMKHLAAFFGSKKPVAGAAGNKDTVRLGEQIYRGGIASKQVPACSGCHSPNGAGIPAQYPRANNAQMSTIAGKMNDREIAAVADYIAGLR